MPSKLSRYENYHLTGLQSEAAWSEILEKVYYGHAVKTGPTGRVSGWIETRSFANINVSRHYGNAHQISRTPSLVAVDSLEQHAIVLVTSGSIDWRQNRRNATTDSGGAYILRASEAFEVSTAQNTATSTIIIPSDICRENIRGIDEKGCLSHSEPVLIKTVAGFVNSVLDSDTNADHIWLRDVVLDILDAALNPRYSESAKQSWRTSEAARSVFLDLIRKVISKHLHLEVFSVLDAAKECKTSVRHLQSVLQSAETTFTHELLEARLLRASQMLRSASRGAKRIGQIAHECGFANHTHFSTRYKERFGIRPTDEIPNLD